VAIYGINFNGTEIPPGVARKFPKRLKLTGMQRGEYAHLEGVAQSPTERDQMLVQADNGRRKLHVEPRLTPAGTWYGIYAHSIQSVPNHPDVAGALGRVMKEAR
jgi:hypothetical protein